MHPPRRYALVVFDWDGTLADSTALIADAIRNACRDMDQPVPEMGVARHVIGLGFTSAVAYVAPALDVAAYPAFAAAYRKYYVAGESRVVLFDGARELLQDLDAAGYRLGVATGKSRAGLEHALEHCGLQGVFHATRCADEGHPKPNPDMLFNLMRFLGVEPDRTLMVGDTSHDLELARNAGTDSVAVTYGAHPSAALAALTPRALVDSVDGLRAWLADNA